MKEATFFAGDATERLTAIREELIKKARIDLNDFFEFLISGPKMELENPPDGGARFAVEAKIDGKVFSTFDLDIGSGNRLIRTIWMFYGCFWDGRFSQLKNHPSKGLLNPLIFRYL